MVNRRKGFTLAELLIVVAIVGILVAVSIPIFTSQLEKSREATDIANMRAAKAAAVAAYYDIESSGTSTYEGLEKKGNASAGTWYEGFYNIATGSFVTTGNVGGVAKNVEGKGTTVDGKSDYPYYESEKNYRNLGIFVQIVTKSGNSTPKAIAPADFKSNQFKDGDVGVHVQWRTLYSGHHIQWDCGYDFVPTK